MSEPAPSLLALFGIDAGGRTHGSRFEPAEFEAAAQAAATMAMFSLKAETPELVDLVGQLPKGKLFKSGSAFVPFVGKKLYDQLIAAGEAAGAAFTRPATTSAKRPAKAASKPDDAPAERSKSQALPPWPKNLPMTWASIDVGSLVLVADEPADGFFPAVVTAIKDREKPEDRVLTVRFRDFPEYISLSRKVHQVALFHVEAIEELKPVIG